MMPAPIRVDFFREIRPSRLSGLVVGLLGAVVCALVMLKYSSVSTEADIVAMQLPVDMPRQTRAVSTGLDETATKSIEESIAALNIPWGKLFRDLEVALADQSESVALLQLEPDLQRRQVRIAAEASSLPAAIAYVRRLQDSETLRFPHLDSHEIQVEQRERPVYFEMTALWNLPK